MTTSLPTRRPYHGSCHCGLTRYIAYITLPPQVISSHPSPTTTTRIRRCNCSTCHKTSFFHIRLPNAPEDFVLLSPLAPTSTNNLFGGLNISPSNGLKDYKCFDNRIHWFFCSECGVRCFAFCGEGELRDVEVPHEVEGKVGEEVEGEKKIQKVWTPKREGWDEERDGKDKNWCFLSINASTIEARQEGFDMREWTEKGWVIYLDVLKEVEEDRLEKPFEGGMY